VALSVVQWSKSAGKQCVLCTVITRMLLDHIRIIVQGGSNMTGTNCDLFTHKQSRSYLNHLVHMDTSFIILLYTPLSFCVLCL
jgi:hypothetical protein